MARLRLASVSCLALVAALSPSVAQAVPLNNYAQTGDQQTVAQIFDRSNTALGGGSPFATTYNNLFVNTNAGIADSLQSMLPTSALGYGAVANTLASIEETNIMGHLRAVRQHGSGTIAAAANEPVASTIRPLQNTPETFYDLRGPIKPPVVTGPGETTQKFKMYNPALYKDDDKQAKEANKPNWAERQYNSALNWLDGMAGAPNNRLTSPNATPAPKAPNAIDRGYTGTMKFFDQSAGGSNYNKSATSAYPRRTLTTRMDRDKAAGQYPGQPLGRMGSYYQNQADTPNIIVTPAPVMPSTTVTGSAMEVPPQKQWSGEVPTNGLRLPMPKTFAMVSNSSNNLQNGVRSGLDRQSSTETGTYLWTPNMSDAQEAGSKELTTPAVGNRMVMASAAPVSAPSHYGDTAVRTSSVNADRRWGFFISGDTGFGSDKLQDHAPSTRTVTSGVTVGADYRLADKGLVGLALTYAHGSFTTNSMGDLQSNSFALSLYGSTTYATSAYVDGYISVGYHSLDSERTILAGNGTSAKAKADPNGFQMNGKVETGYDTKTNGWTYGPYGGFRLAYSDFGSVSETGANYYNLKIRSTNNLSAIGNLGVGASRSFSMGSTGNLLAGLRLGYNHEFGDDRTSIKADFVNLANSSFTTDGAKRSRDWMNVTPTVSAQLANNWMFLAQYEHDFFRDDTNESIFNLAARYQW